MTPTLLEDGPPRSWRIASCYDLLRDIQRSPTPDAICASVLNYAARFGARNLLAGLVPPPYLSARTQRSHILLDAWPEEWSRRYFSNGYILHDPAIQLVRRNTPPFAWDEIAAHCAVSESGRRIMAEAVESELRQGVTFSFSTLERQPVGFSMAGERLEIAPGERMSLQLVAAFAFGCATTLKDARSSDSRISLSPRQHEVLSWTAEGLTAEQIGDRLSVSRHTVDMHLRIAREKVGARSSVQAVAEALRLGLIN